jgi:hypothetical protein
MDEFGMKVIVNIVVGIVVFVGFIIFIYRNTELLKEGGILYDLWQDIKKNKNSKKANPSNKNKKK